MMRGSCIREIKAVNQRKKTSACIETRLHLSVCTLPPRTLFASLPYVCMCVARARCQSNRHVPVNLHTSMIDQEKRRETEMEMYPCHYIFSVSSSLRLVLTCAHKLTPNKNVLNTAKYSKGLCRHGHCRVVLVMTERNYTRVSYEGQYTCFAFKSKKKKKPYCFVFLVHSCFLSHLSLILRSAWNGTQERKKSLYCVH